MQQVVIYKMPLNEQRALLVSKPGNVDEESLCSKSMPIDPSTGIKRVHTWDENPTLHLLNCIVFLNPWEPNVTFSVCPSWASFANGVVSTARRFWCWRRHPSSYLLRSDHHHLPDQVPSCILYSCFRGNPKVFWLAFNHMGSWCQHHDVNKDSRLC